MHHASGYPDYYPLDFVDRRMSQAIAPDELLRRYAGGKLDFAPGTRWSYSNTGFILLARVAEQVAGQPLGQLLDTRFFKPLGMNHTVYEPSPADHRLAHGYSSFALSPPTRVAAEAGGWLGGAGGICSTPSDLAKWNLALMEGQVLQSESWKLMTTARELPDGEVHAIRLRRCARPAGRPACRHPQRRRQRFPCWSGMIPSTRSTLVMLCNLEGGLGPLPSQVFALLAQGHHDRPRRAGTRGAGNDAAALRGIAERQDQSPSTRRRV